MRIALASVGDPTSAKTWSGIPRAISLALERKDLSVHPIVLSGLETRPLFDLRRRVVLHATGKWTLRAVEKDYLIDLGKQIERSLLANPCDVVIAIHGDLLSYVQPAIPGVIVHDATFSNLVGYYSAFTNISNRSIRLGREMYGRALRNAAAAVFSADWAASSAVRDFSADEEKIHTIPFGANLDSIPDALTVQSSITNRSQSAISDFLFVGVDWLRKGGPDAIRFVAKLRSLGLDARLTVVGCHPEIEGEAKNFTRVIGFLGKSTQEDSELLHQLYLSATALLVPSHAECFGCVYCEANAYGLPAIARDTGGVSAAVVDGRNGLLMSPDESPEDLALRWMATCQKPETYIHLSKSARHTYEQTLNYDVFVDRLCGEVLDPILSVKN